MRDAAHRAKVVNSQVEPRLVDRRRAVAEAAQRRRRRQGLRLLAGLGVVLVGVAVAFSPWLSVQEVRVEGADSLDEQRVLSRSGVDLGEPMVLVDLAAAREQLAADPQVASASVQREWPDTVVLRVVEERPLALVVTEGQRAFVSAHGRVLDAADGATSLVRVVTDVAVDLSPGARLEGPVARVVSMIRQLSAGTLARVEEIRLGTTGSVEMTLEAGVVVLIGPPEDVHAKLLALDTVLERVVAECMAVIDVRDPMRAAVSRADGCVPPPPTDVAGSGDDDVEQDSSVPGPATAVAGEPGAAE